MYLILAVIARHNIWIYMDMDVDIQTFRKINIQISRYLQSRAKRVETLFLLKRIFWSPTFLFSFTPLPPISMLLWPQNLSDSLTYSTLKKGEGRIGRMQCNFIENEGKSKDYKQIFDECLNHFARDCRYMHNCDDYFHFFEFSVEIIMTLNILQPHNLLRKCFLRCHFVCNSSLSLSVRSNARPSQLFDGEKSFPL